MISPTTGRELNLHILNDYSSVCRVCGVNIRSKNATMFCYKEKIIVITGVGL